MFALRAIITVHELKLLQHKKISRLQRASGSTATATLCSLTELQDAGPTLKPPPPLLCIRRLADFTGIASRHRTACPGHRRRGFAGPSPTSC